MRKSRLLSLPILLSIASLAGAQVVAPVEIREPELRALQQSSMSQLKVVAQNITSHHFDYPFYCSRKLDIDEKQQQRVDQHSIRFERFNGSMVLAVSGNYYGAYPADKFSEGLRARQTLLRVVLPIVKAAVPVLQSNPQVQGYAIEVSHHVIGRTMGMPVERAENLMVYLPQSAAIKLATAKDKQAQQAALLEAEVFLNANLLSLWLTDGEQPLANEVPRTKLAESTPTLIPAAPIASGDAGAKAQPLAATVAPDPKPPVTAPPPPPATAPAPVRDPSPRALAALQSSIQGISNHMLKELEPQAHFVAYAPPAFIAFRHQAYLELSVGTGLSQPKGTSRYKLAALAFDEHISPLIRRVLAYFPGDQNFDGISFSTTVHTPSKPGSVPAKPLSVEFFFPLSALHSYESYDCTGQQLLDAGIVLVNGERVGIDLQMAAGSGLP
jgi:hypothetical protein